MFGYIKKRSYLYGIIKKRENYFIVEHPAINIIENRRSYVSFSKNRSKVQKGERHNLG